VRRRIIKNREDTERDGLSKAGKMFYDIFQDDVHKQDPKLRVDKEFKERIKKNREYRLNEKI